MEFASTELPTHFNPATCVRKGLCPVTKLRPQGHLESHSLYFEQHGKGTKYKIVLIMGLNSSSFGWKAQVDYFGGGKAFQDEDGGGEGEEKSTVLVFDNRGVGNSGYPMGPYSTRAMAEDVVTLLDYVGWTGEREVHVVGISLGGMIAQASAEDTQPDSLVVVSGNDPRRTAMEQPTTLERRDKLSKIDVHT
ncbi:hypothetical protein NP233_g11205 [Leucocoprinus birnbaumii]|uniref:AB hydrolase-1 domain-containing protein n=1 Tax=Leucocoprinus birnbaumii TaxID=56174 RepID=A0AAD5VMY0_9AGAR|nr:hypothetical protein NP233_g11205 [Leucocoprinus birnbaumii]